MKPHKVDVRKTIEFQTKCAEELGLTLNQYLGLEPIQVIHFNKKKK